MASIRKRRNKFNVVYYYRNLLSVLLPKNPVKSMEAEVDRSG